MPRAAAIDGSEGKLISAARIRVTMRRASCRRPPKLACREASALALIRSIVPSAAARAAAQDHCSGPLPGPLLRQALEQQGRVRQRV